MALQTLLDNLHPDWLGDEAMPEAATAPLFAAGRRSRLGQRLLVRALPAELVDGLLAPTPGSAPCLQVARRWPRARLQALLRDLGVLAHAPLIRAEVRREPVRWLRRSLGNSYLLALDRSVWDGRVERAVHARLSADWETLPQRADGLPDAAQAGAMFQRQGLTELVAWASRRDRLLADWSRLLFGADSGTAHLPEKAVLHVATHHERRDGGSVEG